MILESLSCKALACHMVWDWKQRAYTKAERVILSPDYIAYEIRHKERYSDFRWEEALRIPFWKLHKLYKIEPNKDYWCMRLRTNKGKVIWKSRAYKDLEQKVKNFNDIIQSDTKPETSQ